MPDELRNADSDDSLKRFLKTTSLAASSVTSALEVLFSFYALNKSTLYLGLLTT